jgi:hypothetical protein
MATLD